MAKARASDLDRRYTDRELMEQTIALARQCKSEPGRVSPKVGALVTRDGRVLDGAFRGEFEPGEHAEFTLLERKLANSTLAGATLFTTLEPCTKRTPPKLPCAERIIERRLARVVIGVVDPNDEIRGQGELRLREAGIHVARFDSDLMPIIEELNRDFSRLHRGSHIRRTAEQSSDPPPPEGVGPNGHRIGYTPEGDKVEWVPDEERPGEEWPLLLRRNDTAILQGYNEFWDRVWWVRHQVTLERVRRGETVPSSILAQAKAAATEIERKYGRETLILSDFEFGLLSGKLSALAWILGAEWEESLDT